MSIQLDEPPVPKFRAEIAQADAGLDIALLRITRELDGRLIEPQSLALPFVELADSGSVNLDDTIMVAGYPSFGNDAVTVTKGTINGFVAEPSSLATSDQIMDPHKCGHSRHDVRWWGLQPAGRAHWNPYDCSSNL